MKARLRKAVSLVLAACMMMTTAACLTACHGSRSSESFTIPEEFDTSRSYEITFWAKNDTNKTQTEIYSKAVEEFEKLYPNITVNIRFYTDYTKIYNDVITNISTGTTPNVCITYPDHIATYMTGENVVVPLDDLFADSKYGLGGSELEYDSPTVEEIIPQFLQECEIGGVHYAIPYMRSTEALYINQDMVEALGYEIPDIVTWDFIWEVSEAAMAKNSDGTFVINGQNVLIPFIYKSTDNMMIQLLKQQGAGYSDENGNILIFNDTTRQDLLTIASHAATGAFSTFKISSYPANFLNAGQCIFAVDSTAGATWMGSDAPLSDIAEESKVDFTTAVRPVPQVDPDNPQMISQGPSICIFNKDDPQEVLASWIFAQFLLTDEVQIAYSETEGYVPVTSKAQESAEYQDYLSRAGEDNSTYYDIKIQAASLLLEHVDETFTTPVFNGSASLRECAGALIENVTKSERRHQTVDDAYLDELFANMKTLYRLDQTGSASRSDVNADLGPLPAGSKALLIGLAVVWAGILTVFLAGRIRAKKTEQKA